MRRRGSAEQRVWLGPGRYRGRCRNAVTNAEPESYAHSNRYAFGMRSNVAHTNSNSNGYCYPNGDSDSHANRDGHSYRDGYS